MMRYFRKESPSAAEVPDLRIALVEALELINQRLGMIETDLTRLRAASAIRLLDFELRRDPRYSDPKRLLASGAQVSSQNAEDGMIDAIFRRIGHGSRVFAEVGVGDGTENNTAFLVAQGWQGFWFDGADDFAQTLQSRPDVSGQVKGLVGILTRENVDEVFTRVGVPEEFDLLSLDVDQNTYYLWQGLRRFRPRAVIVEYNAAVPPDVDWKVNYHPTREWDHTSNFGASLKAFENLGRELGYSLVGCDFLGVNAFFVRNDLTGDRFAEPFTAANHYEPPRYALTGLRGHRRAILDSPGPAS